MADIAVLLMAHGAPSAENDVEAYLTNIRKGRQPQPIEIEDLKERYRKIGGRSPLLDITVSQASALEEALNSAGLKTQVHVGMKHWHPYVEEVVPKILEDGIRRIIALVLAPYYSALSIGEYRQRLYRIREASRSRFQIDFINSWYDHSLFHLAVAEKINDALKQFLAQTREKVEIIFTTHSLPESILQEGDPYPNQFHSSCRAVADLLKIDRWFFAYQSAKHTGGEWLGPDIRKVLGQSSLRANASGGNVLIVPIGFVADHLEILYDIDVEIQTLAKVLHLTVKRTNSLNASPTFISALADIVRRQLT